MLERQKEKLPRDFRKSFFDPDLASGRGKRDDKTPEHKEGGPFGLIPMRQGLMGMAIAMCRTAGLSSSSRVMGTL